MSLIAVNNIIVVTYWSKFHRLSLSLIAVNETPVMGWPYSTQKNKQQKLSSLSFTAFFVPEWKSHNHTLWVDIFVLPWIFRCSSSSYNPVYSRYVDSSDLVFSLSSHDIHSYVFSLALDFSIHNKQQLRMVSRTASVLESIMWIKWGSPIIPFGRGDLRG